MIRNYSLILILLLTLHPVLPVYGTEYTDGLRNWPEMSLSEVLKVGLKKNLNLQIEAINVQIESDGLIRANAFFDPAFEASISGQNQRIPTASAFSEDADSQLENYDGEAKVSKKFRSGFDSSIGFLTLMEDSNSIMEGLSPRYRSYFLMNLTQPLLKGHGAEINNSESEIAKYNIKQANLKTIARAQLLVKNIEIAYYDMAQAIKIYEHQIRSRDMADELLNGNREKFEAGMSPISEVQEAETAVASRDELVLTAQQNLESAGNRLKDLLEVSREELLSNQFFQTTPLPDIDQDYPDIDSSMKTALGNRLDLQRQKLEIEKSDIKLAWDRNQKLARLDLKATLGLNGLSGKEQSVTIPGFPSVTSPYTGSYPDSIRGMAQGDGFEWFLGVTYSIPIGNRAAAAQFSQSKLSKKQAVYQLKRLEKTIETEVLEGQIVINRSLERVKVTRRFRDLAEKTLSQEQERLKAGLSDTFRVLTFQNSLIDAYVRHVTALGDFNKGLASLFYAMGTNLERQNIVYSIPQMEGTAEGTDESN